jgi:hypothetical protein
MEVDDLFTTPPVKKRPPDQRLLHSKRLMEDRNASLYNFRELANINLKRKRSPTDKGPLEGRKMNPNH